MATIGGSGANTAESELICTAFASCAGSGTRLGEQSVLTGISGGTIITTSALDGSGEDIDALDDIFIGDVSTSVGTALTGVLSARTGTCIAEIITTIVCMAELVGLGEATGASVCICTGCARSIEIIKDIGGVCGLTGISGVETSTTDDRAGSGPTVTARLAVISTGCESSVGGTVAAGTMSGAIGTYIVATITIIISMGELVGLGLS